MLMSEVNSVTGMGNRQKTAKIITLDESGAFEKKIRI